MLLGLALLLLDAPDASACHSDKILAPTWLSRPTGQDILEAYPHRALERQLSGHTTMRCIVDSTGKMSKCEIVEETPAGHGFGDAELKLAPLYRMTITQPNGCSNIGAVMVIPMRWSVG